MKTILAIDPGLQGTGLAFFSITGLKATSVPNQAARAEVMSTYTWENAASQLEKALLP